MTYYHMNNKNCPEVLSLKEEEEWLVGQVNGRSTSLHAEYYVFCKTCMFAQHAMSWESNDYIGSHADICTLKNKPPIHLTNIAKFLRDSEFT